MSSSLAILPNPHDEIASLRRQLEAARHQLAITEDDLRTERAKNANAAQGVAAMQQVLTPLYNALRKLFDEMDSHGIADVAPAVDSRKQAVWAAWKQRLPGIPSKIIDALLLHGALTQTQLRIHAGCARSSIPSAVSALHRAGLIDKGNGKISLKEL